MCKKAIDHQDWGERNNPQAETSRRCLPPGALPGPYLHVGTIPGAIHYHPGQPGHS
jgi:hypothetical protein